MKIIRRQSKEVVMDRHLNIVKDYNDGMLVKDIAEKFKCSTESIYYALRKIESLNEGNKDDK